MMRQFPIHVTILFICSVMAAAPEAQTRPPEASAASSKEPHFAIVLHGGAGAAPAEMTDQARLEYQKDLATALEIGRGVLARGGTSLEAVEAVIRNLEDNDKFNAGKGAVLNAEGGHELDASIMDGRTRACGAVANVKTAKNPISLAKLVMTKTPHVLLAGDGADKFAAEMGVVRVEQSYYRTERRVQAWKDARASVANNEVPAPYYGTVGCVALDRFGNLAAGTSTGGLTIKKFGRVGDSPIIGAGTFADNQTCGVSCTGIGEKFIRNAVSHDISALMEYKKLTLRQAVKHVVHEKLNPGDGGVIAVSRDGSIVMEYNTLGMYRGAADSKGRFEVGIGEKLVVRKQLTR